MDKKIKWIVGLLVLVIVIAGAALLYNNLAPGNAGDNMVGGEQQGQQELQDAPDFIVFDADDAPVSLSDFKGKPVVVNFWASFCPPCKQEMPEFEQAFQEYGDEVQFMMVNVIDNVQETAESGKEYLSTVDYTFPVYFDLEGSASIAYNVLNIPVTLFINAEGKLVAYANSALSYDHIVQGIGMITE